MKSPAAMRAAADTVEACAIGPDTDALIVLLARMAERKAMGTLQADELGAFIRLLSGGSSPKAG